jgi:hypothetical protein
LILYGAAKQLRAYDLASKKEREIAPQVAGSPVALTAPRSCPRAMASYSKLNVPYTVRRSTPLVLPSAWSRTRPKPHPRVILEPERGISST